MNHDNDPII